MKLPVPPLQRPRMTRQQAKWAMIGTSLLYVAFGAVMGYLCMEVGTWTAAFAFIGVHLIVWYGYNKVCEGVKFAVRPDNPALNAHIWEWVQTHSEPFWEYRERKQQMVTECIVFVPLLCLGVYLCTKGKLLIGSGLVALAIVRLCLALGALAYRRMLVRKDFMKCMKAWQEKNGGDDA